MTGIRLQAAAAAVFLTFFGTSQQAAAQGAYAAAYNNIFALNITSTDASGLNGPFFIPLADFTSFTVVSATAATLNGAVDPVNPANSDVNGGPADANPAFGLGSVFPGPAPANNEMGLLGFGGNYARAGAQVSSTALSQPVPGGPITPTLQSTQAWGVAEAYIATNGFAAAASLNASTTGFNTTFTLQQPAIINIDFQAHPFVYVVMDPGAAGGSTNGNIETSVTITSGSGTVFDWSPDGVPGGITGGTELSDTRNLNGSVEVTTPGDNAFVNVTGLPDVGNISPTVGVGTFSARTNVLPAGIYTLSLDMFQNVDVLTGALPPVYDYGDNPDGGAGTATGDYATTAADGGARHLITGPYLGLCVDADDGTLQGVGANADDTTITTAVGTCGAGGDEDGVGLPGTMQPGLGYTLTLEMPAGASIEPCVVDGWIDFNADGDFADAGENIITALNVGAGSGSNAVNFTVPATALPGTTYSRFRCTRSGAAGPDGEEDSGEVEDYPVAFALPPPPVREIPVMGPGALALLGGLLTLLAARGRRM